MKTLRHLLSFILPVIVLIIIPLIIEDDFRLEELWSIIPGIGLIGVGMLIIINTIVMFIEIGRGTLAPWDPTRNIVTEGLYAYARNPMILGVLIVLIGESLLFRSISIALWSILFFLSNHLYFIISEEPGLEKRFGQDYAIHAVYYDYDKDETAPYAYFIGCKVSDSAEIPPNLSELLIPAQTYLKRTARGVMPACIAEEWQKIWASKMDRKFGFDFEIYDERSMDWSNAEVDIFLSVNN